MKSRFLHAPDGSRLHLLSLGSPSAPRQLLVVHGYGEHGGRYVDRLQCFAEAGYHVLLPDMRGHGLSSGQRGFVRRFETYLQDLDLIRSQALAPDKPTGVFGHSNGGLIALRWLQEGKHKLQAAALTSPLLGIAVKAPAWKVQAGHLLSARLPWLSLPSEILPEHLSHDPRVVADYQQDPRVHHVVNTRWFTEATAAMEQAFLAGAASIRTPLLLMQAAGDRIVDPSAVERWALAAVPAAPAGLVYESVPDAFHELLFEVDGAVHASRLLRWFQEHCEGP